MKLVLRKLRLPWVLINLILTRTTLKEVDVPGTSTTSGVTSGVSTKSGGTDSGASTEVSTYEGTASKDSTFE